MKTKSLFLFAAFSTLISLASCGNSKKNDPKVLTIATSGDVSENDILTTFRRGFLAKEENKDITISIIKINDNYDSWINKKLYVDQVPDLIQVYDYSSEFWTNFDTDGRGNGLFYPISEYFNRDGLNENDYFPSIIEMTKSGPSGDNNMYWMPRDYNKVVCVYNKKIFDAAGISYPTSSWTYDDFVSISESLLAKKDSITQYSKTATFYPADMNLNWQAFYYPLLKSYNADLIDRENGKALLNEEVVKTQFRKVLDMPLRGLAVPPDNQTSAPFANKQAAMMFVSRPNVTNYVKSLGADNIDFVSMPIYSDKTASQSFVGMGCTGYAITTSCAPEKRETAWKFLKYIISEEGQNAFSKMGSGVPVIKSLANDPESEFRKYLPNANNDAFVSDFERDIPMNFMKGFHPEKQLGIYTYLLNNCLSNFYKQLKKSEQDYLSYFETFKKSFENTWTK